MTVLILSEEDFELAFPAFNIVAYCDFSSARLL